MFSTGFCTFLYVCMYMHKTRILHAGKQKALHYLESTEPALALPSHHAVCKLVFHLTKQNRPATAVTAFFM